VCVLLHVSVSFLFVYLYVAQLAINGWLPHDYFAISAWLCVARYPFNIHSFCNWKPDSLIGIIWNKAFPFMIWKVFSACFLTPMSIELGWLSLFDKCESLGKTNVRIGILSRLVNAFEFGGINSKFYIIQPSTAAFYWFYCFIFALPVELWSKLTLIRLKNRN